ncbi:MAG: hypothetical protein Q6370_021435 [Candidatus Sigynarchaeota archaeon]
MQVCSKERWLTIPFKQVASVELDSRRKAIIVVGKPPGRAGATRRELQLDVSDPVLDAATIARRLKLHAERG